MRDLTRCKWFSQALSTSFEDLSLRARLFTDDRRVKMNPNLGLIRVFSKYFFKFLILL
jgi:hypothetical protein